MTHRAVKIVTRNACRSDWRGALDIPRMNGTHVLGYQPNPAKNPWRIGYIGRKAAGRLLDGQTWNQYPKCLELPGGGNGND